MIIISLVTRLVCPCKAVCANVNYYEQKTTSRSMALQCRNFLKTAKENIGSILSGKVKPTGIIDVATVQTLANQKDWQTQVSRYSMIIVDECHHAASSQFEQVLKRYRAKYVLGLSATPNRRDGHQLIVYRQCGPVCYRVNHKKENLSQPIIHRLEIKETDFVSKNVPKGDKSVTIQDVFKELLLDEKRNNQIIQDVLTAYRKGRFCLVLTQRREHIDLLKEALSEVDQLVVLYGSMKTVECKQDIQKLRSFNGKGAVLLATGKLVGEGFNFPGLNTLFLAMPISDRSLLIQYVGRLHRLSNQKVEVQVVDYCDSHDARLNRMFLKRLKVYSAIGYRSEIDDDERLI